MAGHSDPNYVSENPFEGRGRAMQGNDFPDTVIGFTVWTGFFVTMLAIAIIVEVAMR